MSRAHRTSHAAPTAPTKPGGLRGWFSYIVVAALAIIPLVYAGALIWANDDPLGNLDRIPAAIVNEDRGAVLEGSNGERSSIDLGAEVVEALLPDEDGEENSESASGSDSGSESPSNFDWRVEDRATAEAGLAQGRYLVVLTVPATFSADATSSLARDGSELELATRGELRLSTDDSVSYLIGSIAKSVGVAVTESLSQGVSAQYLEGMALGFGDVRDSLLDAAEGAGRLSDGAAELSAGTDAAASGSAALAGGVATAADGAALSR